MIIPVNFVVGAVVGAVSTYVYKDEACKKWFRDTGTKLKNRVYAFTAFPVEPEEKVAESATQTGETVAEEITEKNVSAAAEAENTDKPKSRSRQRPKSA